MSSASGEGDGGGWGEARAAMVADQLRRGGIDDERVLAAMGVVPRELFVPEAVRDQSYDDGALPIGSGQTISQPWVVAAMTAALGLRGGERVLEVGTGSGYSAAVAAEVVRPGGSVTTVELDGGLAERAHETLAALGYDEVRVIAGDITDAIGDGGWDAVAVHAAAPAVPPALAAALRPHARLVIPLAEQGADMLVSHERVDDGSHSEARLEATPLARCRFVPLRGESGFPARGR